MLSYFVDIVLVMGSDHVIFIGEVGVGFFSKLRSSHVLNEISQKVLIFEKNICRFHSM